MMVGRLSFVWLSLLAVINGAQGMVLCTGAHGHVAIESVDHCHCPNTNHNPEGYSVAYRTETSGHTEHHHCKSCVDIPLSWGPVSSNVISPSDGAAGFIMEMLESSFQYQYNTSISFYTSAPLITYHLPLDSIVLQV